MMTLYVICLMVGLIFAFLSFILSGGFEAHVDAGADAGMDMDADGDIAGGDVGVGDVHFPLFSPVVIASFVAFFGAGGIVGLKVFFLLPIASLLVAVGFGLGMGLLVGFVLMKIYKHLQTDATTKVKSLIGLEAEVVEGIPAEGVGQIAFAGKGQRISGPARSEEKKDIKRHAVVTITRVVGGLYWVREHVDEKLRDVAGDQDASPAVPSQS
jgi:membrane protein implicated in regulation of membrane protease activity